MQAVFRKLLLKPFKIKSNYVRSTAVPIPVYGSTHTQKHTLTDIHGHRFARAQAQTENQLEPCAPGQWQLLTLNAEPEGAPTAASRTTNCELHTALRTEERTAAGGPPPRLHVTFSCFFQMNSSA